MRVLVAAAFFTCAAVLGGTAGASADDGALCYGTPILEEIARPGSDALSCTIRPGDLYVTSSYYQNASKVGGTALAAYPLVALQTGVVRRVDVELDAPSQLAESGPRGNGLYPKSHAGYGVRYQVARTNRVNVFSDVRVDAPASPFATNAVQSPLGVGLDSTYRVSPGLTLAELADVSETPHATANAQARRSDRLGAALSADGRTLLWTDLGVRAISAQRRAQGFGDVSVDRVLARRVSVDLGLGTTINPVAKAKAHYLSTGLTLRP